MTDRTSAIHVTTLVVVERESVRAQLRAAGVDGDDLAARLSHELTEALSEKDVEGVWTARVLLTRSGSGK